MFNILYIKKIIDRIVTDECMKNGIDKNKLHVYSISTVEYNINKFFNKKFKLNGQIVSYSPKECEAIYSNKYKNLILYIDNGKKIKRMSLLLIMIYHELEHYHQKQLKISNIDEFAIYMDKKITFLDKNNYYLNHDTFMNEIMANYIGINKTRKLINRENIRGIQLDKDNEYLKLFEQIFTYDYYNYNYYEKFTEFIKLYRRNIYNIKLPECFNIFLNNDGTFKSIKEILRSEINDILYIVLGSDIFRSQLDLTSLTEEEIKVIEKAKQLRLIKEEKIKQNHEYFINNEYNLQYEENKKIYQIYRRDRINRYKLINTERINKRR